MSINFNFTTIFCDDVRHELNGKLSLMGIYNIEMYVSNFPITLPKVCAFFELRLPPDVDVNTEAILTVMKGTEKVSSISVAIPSPETRSKSSHGKPPAHLRFAGAMEFPSMVFIEPTLLEVAAQIGDQSIIGGRLWVTNFPQSEEVVSAAASKDGDPKTVDAGL